MEISIIGLGGIGSVLVNTISRFLNSNENLKPITIKLVDGDDYEYKNISRQEFYNYGNKANVKKRELSNRFQDIDYLDFQMFLDENNISEIVTENSIVFVSVDNHKTRRLVSNYAKKLNNVIVISGGNELTDGNIQIFIRKGGENVTPSLTDYHPEIENPLDKSPDEMSCEELSHAEPQLYFTNFMVAGHMCSAFYNIIERNNYKISEVYFDILSMNSNSKTRVPKNIRG
jgi:molybdopterin/thiamine biosynthesis adenylyltransferase